eukprot:4867077-Amphidinium_carterae.1
MEQTWDGCLIWFNMCVPEEDMTITRARQHVAGSLSSKHTLLACQASLSSDAGLCQDMPQHTAG